MFSPVKPFLESLKTFPGRVNQLIYMTKRKELTSCDIVKLLILLLVLIVSVWFAYVTTTIAADRDKPVVQSVPYNINDFDLPDTEVSLASYQAGEQAMDYLNQIRRSYLKPEIESDKRVFNLAKARAADMAENGYLDHTSPSGICADSMKSAYEINNFEFVAENIYFGDTQDMQKVIDAWMQSRGHRFNLLYEGHTAGAIACHDNMCVFLGLNEDGYGSGCHTAAESSLFWENSQWLCNEV